MESSKEQQILEAAACHLILLSNPPLDRQSYNGYDHSGYRSDRSFMRIKRKFSHFKNSKPYAKSSSTFSSSSESSSSITSGILVMDEDEQTRNHGHRMRSIVDIYSVTRPL
ncbi:hypothetical protein SSX86_009583 [Deinandra increscens subsp. villosa]|uniref:Uncharacterized protein n=1 Tax=Deinandra increscens subsp. villosa TaxID=3103831 RepID=A0AAP0DDL6_9ASTR